MRECLRITQDGELGAQSPRELIDKSISVRPIRIETTAVRHPYERLTDAIDEALSWWAFQPCRSDMTARLVETQCEDNGQDRNDNCGTNVSDTQENRAAVSQSSVQHGS